MFQSNNTNTEAQAATDDFVGILVFSHQDIAWEDTPDNCDLLREKIFFKALELLEKYPEYRYLIEDSYILKKFLELNPGAYDRVYQALKQGRLEIGATYTMPNESLLNGECLGRQFYFGQKWLQKTFPGYSSILSTNIDVPGEALQYSQLASKAGVKLRILNKNKPYRLFKWESPDGSQLITQFLAQRNYGSTTRYGPVPKPFSLRSLDELLARDPNDLDNAVGPVRERYNLPLILLIFHGCDMTFPDEEAIHTLRKYRKTNIRPKIQFCSPKRFYEMVKDLTLPTMYGEIPNDWCYMVGPCNERAMTSARLAQNLLPSAEIFSVIAQSLNPYFNYPTDDFTQAWEGLIRTTDHGWSGVNGRQTNAIYSSLMAQAAHTGKNALNNALQSIAGHVKVKSEGIPVIVFNPLSWERSADLAGARLFFPEGKIKNPVIIDTKGKEIPCQIERKITYSDGSIKEAELFFAARKVPSIGYKTYYVKDGQKSSSQQVSTWENNVLENDFYRIEFCKGGIKSILDKQRKKELLFTDKFFGGELFVIGDNGLYTEPDKRDLSYFERMSKYGAAISLVENSILRSIVELKSDFAGCRFTERIILYKDLPRIDIDVELDWDGARRRQVRLAFPLKIDRAQISYEVPFGVVELGRNEFPNPQYWQSQRDKPFVEWNPYDIDIFARAHRTSREVQNWLDVSSDDIGIAMSGTVLTYDYRDCTPDASEYPIIQPVLLATKLCSGRCIWHEQTGHHSYHLSLMSHEPGWKQSYHTGWEFNNPLIALVPQTKEGAQLAEKMSFLKIEPDNVLLSTMKRCEDDNNIIVRLFEMEGKDCEVKIEFFKSFEKMANTNLIEQEEGTLKLNETGSFRMGHNEVKTIKCWLGD